MPTQPESTFQLQKYGRRDWRKKSAFVLRRRKKSAFVLRHSIMNTGNGLRYVPGRFFTISVCFHWNQWITGKVSGSELKGWRIFYYRPFFSIFDLRKNRGEKLLKNRALHFWFHVNTPPPPRISPENFVQVSLSLGSKLWLWHLQFPFSIQNTRPTVEANAGSLSDPAGVDCSSGQVLLSGTSGTVIFFRSFA